MITVKIVERQGAHARWFTYDDGGREIRQTDRDVPAEVAEAKRRHISLQRILEEEES